MIQSHHKDIAGHAQAGVADGIDSAQQVFLVDEQHGLLGVNIGGCGVSGGRAGPQCARDGIGTIVSFRAAAKIFSWVCGGIVSGCGARFRTTDTVAGENPT